jgi:hypothetical protein
MFLLPVGKVARQRIVSHRGQLGYHLAWMAQLLIVIQRVRNFWTFKLQALDSKCSSSYLKYI